MKQPALSPAEVAELFRAVFLVDVRGRAILEHLERKYCMVEAVVTTGGIDAILTTYQRAAHRELLDYIQNQIERAGSPPAETPVVNT